MIEALILRAKAASYVGNGARAAASRPGSHDLTFQDSDLSCRDSYFGGTGFLGQKVVRQGEQPIWAMNFYGRALRDDLLNASQGGAVIKVALSAIYRQARFPGGFVCLRLGFACHDQRQGDGRGFTGQEGISKAGLLAYRRDGHGGLIRA